MKRFGIFESNLAIKYVTFVSERRKLVGNGLQNGPVDFSSAIILLSDIFISSELSLS